MLKLACVHSNTSRAKQNYHELEDSYEFVSPEQADVIVTLGGDGQMLNTLHAYMHLEKPIYGMNSGSVGFLMNEYQQDRLIERVEAASTYKLFPLATEAVTKDGATIEDLAFNEVAVTRGTGQSANIRIVVDDVVRLDCFMGDGIIVSTPAGSTAYNLSAHGPIIPLGSNLLALTPVSPFRPRRWRGALLPRKTRIELINLDVDNRPLLLTADFNEYSNIQSATIWEDATRSVNVLFDKDHSLEERVIREQFTE